MKRKIMLLTALVIMLGMTAVPVAAHEHVPPHGHMLILGIQFDETGEPVSYQKCVDLANNRALPLHAHHETVHTGTAGEALFNAGHVVVPTSPLTPFADCAHLAELFGPPSR
jgi:hypothetical protein